ncbi:ABC-type Fe3+-hydroxamate transport system, substrate-binding protein [Chitinophaga jiangningensis]|uniref:ABC-type Fe3+-hydroxamate transport system, substrate-binding protein n=1 Tax=Chitinophaga jiangningensis TaxID=1419482 RepID=A0A1M7MZY5_9BACT|nr:helical backbone metal receptor [Chitinophaga jiangningensis]SHM96223.1 ABC-type Fe3+-hydroxamate transport system, substrate-binding protein [Chitinophaga jiangningensis]
MEFTDQLHRTIILDKAPARIVSLVPSQTELLHSLGLDERVVGITKFCVHPAEWFRSKTRVGGTKNVHLDQVRALQPDLIIANKEENTRADIEALMKEFPVWVSDIHSLEDALGMIAGVGALTQRSAKAAAMIAEIEQDFAALQPLSGVRTAYFIWREPWMVAGNDTFIHQMLQRCGLTNVYGHVPRYPDISLKQLATTDCELIFLSSEPYPFKEKHIAELQELIPAARIQLVDGEYFSWYGSRLKGAPAYFSGLIASLREAGFQ